MSIGLVLPEDKQSELSVEICSSDHILYLDKIEQDTKQTEMIQGKIYVDHPKSLLE